ncbi:Uncharacterised protein [Streptococcus pneumoniae]|nr:Uncharacterised protein [Streptococcus pneumoniae]
MAAYSPGGVHRAATQRSTGTPPVPDRGVGGRTGLSPRRCSRSGVHLRCPALRGVGDGGGTRRSPSAPYPGGDAPRAWAAPWLSAASCPPATRRGGLRLPGAGERRAVADTGTGGRAAHSPAVQGSGHRRPTPQGGCRRTRRRRVACPAPLRGTCAHGARVPPPPDAARQVVEIRRCDVRRAEGRLPQRRACRTHRPGKRRRPDPRGDPACGVGTTVGSVGELAPRELVDPPEGEVGARDDADDEDPPADGQTGHDDRAG